jgi:hypothetical protein
MKPSFNESFAERVFEKSFWVAQAAHVFSAQIFNLPYRAVSPICNRQGARDSRVSRFCQQSAGYKHYKPAIQRSAAEQQST